VRANGPSREMDDSQNYITWSSWLKYLRNARKTDHGYPHTKHN
jgi:hypothetical protein